MTVLTQVLTICRGEFSKHVDAYGVDARWHRRSNNIRTTGSDISVAASSPDHTDTTWVPELDDPNIYPVVADIHVLKDIPEDISFGAVHHILSGQSLAYVEWDTQVLADDILVMDSERWHVLGSRLVSPAVYRELTLRRVG